MQVPLRELSLSGLWSGLRSAGRRGAEHGGGGAAAAGAGAAAGAAVGAEDLCASTAPALPLLQVWPSQDSPRGDGGGGDGGGGGGGQSFVFPGDEPASPGPLGDVDGARRDSGFDSPQASPSPSGGPGAGGGGGGGRRPSSACSGLLLHPAHALRLAPPPAPAPRPATPEPCLPAPHAHAASPDGCDGSLDDVRAHANAVRSGRSSRSSRGSAASALSAASAASAAGASAPSLGGGCSSGSLATSCRATSSRSSSTTSSLSSVALHAHAHSLHASSAHASGRTSDPWLQVLPAERRRSSTLTARYSLLDALDLEYVLLRAAARGSVGPYSLSESLHKLTFTQSLAFPALARGLAGKRRRSPGAGSGGAGVGGGVGGGGGGAGGVAKAVTALVLMLVSVLVFGAVYKFTRT